MGDLYNRLGCSISEDSLIFIGSFIFCLLLVVSDNLLHPFVIPIVGKFILFHLKSLIKNNIIISEGQRCWRGYALSSPAAPDLRLPFGGHGGFSDVPVMTVSPAFPHLLTTQQEFL